jgi:polyhydroxyalkanoate synthase
VTALKVSVVASELYPLVKSGRLADVAGPDPDLWLQTARWGSWWPEWSSWLREQAGAEVPAPKTVGSRKHPRIEAAPGRYMKEKDSETG